MLGQGFVFYDRDFIGEDGYGISYTKTLTNINPIYEGKAIGEALDLDGAGGHKIH
jgi:hypothetical protein